MKASTRPRPKRKPGRPAAGSEDPARAVLAATTRLLGEKGFSALSIDDVARAAGVNKTSVYRRWPTKSKLVIAALQAVVDEEPPFVESGDLRKDLTAMFRRKLSVLADPRGLKIAHAVLALDDGDEARELNRAIRERRNALPIAILRGAIERGALPRDAVPEVLADLLVAPIIYKAVVHGEKVDARYVKTIVEHFLRGSGAASAALSGRRAARER